MLKLGLSWLLTVILIPVFLLTSGCDLFGGGVKIRNYDDAYVTYQALTKSVADTTVTLLKTGALTKAQGNEVYDRLTTIQESVESTKQFRNLSDINVQIQLLTTLSIELNAKKAKVEPSSRLEPIPIAG